MPYSGYGRTTQRLKSVLFCVVLAGCGVSRQASEVADATLEGWNKSLAECRNAHPDQITQAVARAVCFNKAIDLLRPVLPFPDLLDQEKSMRISLAEQVQARTISLIERNRQFAQLHARILAEEQSRLLANPAIPAHTLA